MARLLRHAAATGAGGAPALADFTFSADSQAEPMPVGTAVVGDAEIATGITVSRIRWDGTVLRINRAGAGSLLDWAAADGAGRAFTFTVDGADTPAIPVTNRGQTFAGSIRWTLDAVSGGAILDTIAAGSAMRLRVA